LGGIEVVPGRTLLGPL